MIIMIIIFFVILSVFIVPEHFHEEELSLKLKQEKKAN